MQYDMQSLFNKIATHLITQGERSIGEGGRCQYRGRGNRKCAVGCLIPDEAYIPEMENCAIRSEGYNADGTVIGKVCGPDSRGPNRLKEVLENMGIKSDSKLWALCAKLQWLHDRSEPHEWEGQLRLIARHEGLGESAIDEVVNT